MVKDIEKQAAICQESLFDVHYMLCFSCTEQAHTAMARADSNEIAAHGIEWLPIGGIENKPPEKYVYTVREVAGRLNTTSAWVYKHKYSLGGFQPSRNGNILFTEKALEGALNANQIQREQVAGAQDDRRDSQNKSLRNKGRGKKVGSQPKPGILDRSGDPGRHGLGMD